MAEKNYIKGIFIKESKYGLKVSINLKIFFEDLQKIQNEKGYANLEILPRKEKGKYGDSHYTIEDTWKPDPNYKKEDNQDRTDYGHNGIDPDQKTEPIPEPGEEDTEILPF